MRILQGGGEIYEQGNYLGLVRNESNNTTNNINKNINISYVSNNIGNHEN